jgi:hypothetical protein
MESLIGTFSPVPTSEMEETLRPLTLEEMRHGIAVVRAEISEMEEWLGAPPADASSDEILNKIYEWDQASQWLCAYEEALAAGEDELGRLREELAEIEGLEKGLEEYLRGPMSLDEMAAGDAHEADLERRKIRVMRRLDQLGALPVAEREDAEYCASLLAAERRGREILGAGCQWCDAHFGCNCWAERAEQIRAEERARVRSDRAAIAAAIRDGKCYCDNMTQDEDYPSLCDICQREEELRCKGCGQLQCRPGCCGDCGSCSKCRGPACKGCGGWESDCTCYDDRDGASSCGCGACEEHRSWDE